MVNFSYVLGEHGWATIHATLDGTRLAFRVSYMSRALEDFTASVIALMSGGAVSRFALIDEPGEHCWVLTREDESVHVLVVHLGSMYRTECYNEGKRPGQRPPEEEGRFVASVRCPAHEFAEAVADMIQGMGLRYSTPDFERTRNPPVPPQMVSKLMDLLERSTGCEGASSC
jgi:hypothetical protein